MIGQIFKQKIFLAVFIGFIFLIAQLITMVDYNMMWDARNHFFRGQAFANFFLYGRKNYQDLSFTKDTARYYKDYKKQEILDKRVSKDPNYRRSIYQDETGTFEWLMKIKPTGHPVLSDIGSAFSNILFYEKLGIVRDDRAYALFSVALASVLVAVFFYWVLNIYGLFPAVIATLTLTTTPLFWAESHYNIKDIPLLVFFSLAIFAFWQGVIKHSLIWIVFSSILGGLALGTKFNALFLPIIIFSWSFVYLFLDKVARKRYSKWWWTIFAYPIIMLLVLIIGWPQLWLDPLGGFINVLNYYKEVGINIDYTPTFRTIFNFSTYPALWIFYTTYPFVVFLAVIGFFGWILKFRKTKDSLPLLFAIWFLITLVRASLPNASIFGGVRHIIEYIPPLSFFAGYGANYLIQNLKFKIFNFKLLASCSPRFGEAGRSGQLLTFIFKLLIILLFVPLIIALVRLHPAENVYFNSLIGGLAGAKKANLTGWGNTDGGIYRLAVVWLNKNAEKNLHVSVGFSEPADFYIPELREDLLADNRFSGYLQKGEYIVALTHNSELEHTYRMLYPETFLNPVYEYKIDGVPLIKIWKNDKEHLRANFNYQDIQLLPKIQEGVMQWDLREERRVVKVELTFDENKNCESLSNGYLRISNDGTRWTILPETYPGGPIDVLGQQPINNKLIAPIAGSYARYIEFVVDPLDSCVLKIRNSLVSFL